jgi:hypothetical protein
VYISGTSIFEATARMRAEHDVQKDSSNFRFKKIDKLQTGILL